MDKKTTLGFTTEIGTFGSMPIQDPTVQPVKEMKELEQETKDPDLKKFLQEQLSK